MNLTYIVVIDTNTDDPRNRNGEKTLQIIYSSYLRGMDNIIIPAKMYSISCLFLSIIVNSP